VFFALILLCQLVGHYLIEKLIFSFCFFTIPDQQGLSKIVAWFGKFIACSHEDQPIFWAGPTMVNMKVDCCRGDFFHCSLWYLSLQRKSTTCETIYSETMFLMDNWWTCFGSSFLWKLNSMFCFPVIPINRFRKLTL